MIILKILADAGIVGLIIGGFFMYQLFRTGFENIQTTNTYPARHCRRRIRRMFRRAGSQHFRFCAAYTAVSMLIHHADFDGRHSGNKFSEEDSRDVEDRMRDRKRRSAGAAPIDTANVTPIEKGRKRIEKD